MKSKSQKQVVYFATGAMIAALYAGATYFCSFFGVAYGPVQFRFSEALTVLSALTPAAIPGLTIGCILGNLSSPMGVWDVVFGSSATLISAILGYKFRKIRVKDIPLISILMPVIFNALIIGAEIFVLIQNSSGGVVAFIITAMQVGLGELVVCIVGGIPLFLALQKTNIFR